MGAGGRVTGPTGRSDGQGDPRGDGRTAGADGATRRPGAVAAPAPAPASGDGDPSGLGPVRRPVGPDLDADMALLDRVLGVGRSYDVIKKELRYGGLRFAVYVINGLFQSLVILETLKNLRRLDGREPSDPAEAVRELLQATIPYAQVQGTDRLDQVVTAVLSGPMAILVEGGRQAVLVDTRYYPDREPNEPDTERLVRGPHDGFVETLIFNTALIRRRLRDPRLRFELVQVGRRSKTDVALAYVDGLTDPDLVARLRRALQAIDIDGIPMAEQPVAEFLARTPWNPFPVVRFTERPDVAAFHLLEGHVVVVTDTSPHALIAPATLFHHIHHPEDFHVNAAVGTYVRWVVLAALAGAVLVPPLWLWFATTPALYRLPSLAFLAPQGVTGFSLPVQFVLAELAIDVMRRAILNTPYPLSTAMGVLGAVIFGQLATRVRLFAPEPLVYMVAAAVASFAVSSLELGMAVRIVRLSLVVLVGVLGGAGLALGLLFWLAVLLRTRSFGVPYLWPLWPFDWHGLRDVLVRRPVLVRNPRPAILRPLDRWRQP
jgi:stage V sporulation protein AF